MVFCCIFGRVCPLSCRRSGDPSGRGHVVVPRGRARSGLPARASLAHSDPLVSSSVAFCWALYRVRCSWGRYNGECNFIVCACCCNSERSESPLLQSSAFCKRATPSVTVASLCYIRLLLYFNNHISITSPTKKYGIVLCGLLEKSNTPKCAFLP